MTLTMSPTIANLAYALCLFQAECPPIPKTKTGKIEGEGRKGAYSYTYKYSDLGGAIETTKQLRLKHGLAVSQFPGKSSLTTILMHTSGEWIAEEMDLLLAKQDPQGQGSAITYGRRYAYCAALGIVSDEDDDGASASRSAPSEQTEAPRGSITQANRREIVQLMAKLGIESGEPRARLVAELLGTGELVDLPQLSKSQAMTILTQLRERVQIKIDSEAPY